MDSKIDCRARSRSAASAFRHHQLLPEDKALAVAERGPEALTADELATLLLNPYALWGRLAACPPQNVNRATSCPLRGWLYSDVELIYPNPEVGTPAPFLA